MKTTNPIKDIITGLSFLAGMFNFISGEFIFSSMLFGLSSIASNLDYPWPVQSNS